VNWNYRVMRHTDGTLAIHEVFYDDGEEVPNGCTVDPVGVLGDDIGDLEATLDVMRLSLLRPVLEYEAIGSGMPKTEAQTDSEGEERRLTTP
jgi:hypothetical protein